MAHQRTPDEIAEARLTRFFHNEIRRQEAAIFRANMLKEAFAKLASKHEINTTALRAVAREPDEWPHRPYHK